MLRGLGAAALTACLVLAGLTVSTTGADAEPVAPPGTITAGGFHTCALTPSGAADCWGDDAFEQNADQPGPYTQLTAGNQFTCGLTPAGASDCWGDDTFGEGTDRPGPFTQLAAGSFHLCGLSEAGAAQCWGLDTFGQSASFTGPFTQVVAGGNHTCALTPAGAADCWGDNSAGQATDRPGPYTQLTAGGRHTCGLTPAGAADCWGDDSVGQATDRTGPFTQLDAGGQHTCGVTRYAGAVDCWGDDSVGQATDQPGPYTQVTAGLRHTCALTPAGAADCWGADDAGQAGDHPGPYGMPASGSGDTSAPVVTSSVQGRTGTGGWYVGDVRVRWTVAEPESPGSLVRTGCADRTVTKDQAATTYSCTATSDGGTSPTATVTVKRDATAPTLDPQVPERVLLRSGPLEVDPRAADATSGVRTADCSSGTSSAAGVRSVTCHATDRAGNRSSAVASYLVEYAVTDVSAPARQRGRRHPGAPLTFRLTSADGAPIPDREALALARSGRVAVTLDGARRGTRSWHGGEGRLRYDRRRDLFEHRATPSKRPVRVTIAVTYPGTALTTTRVAVLAATSRARA